MLCVIKMISAASKSLSWDVLASAHNQDRERISAEEVTLLKMYFCRCL